jgi:outer membrane protein assembly factor BamA
LVQAERLNAHRTGAFYSRLIWLLLALLCGITSVVAQPSGPVISEILIQGNQRVESDAIKIHISSQVGQPLDKAVVDQDIKAIFKMGFFDHASADVKLQGGAAVLTFIVQERPLITDVRYGGMKAIKSNDEKVINAVKLHGGSTPPGSKRRSRACSRYTRTRAISTLR